MYTKTEKIIMWLTTFEFMTYKKARFILDNFSNLEDYFGNIPKYRDKLLSCFDAKEIDEMLQENNLMYIDQVIENYRNLGIFVVTARSVDYPKLLLEIDSYPILLYCKGNLRLLDTDCLAVVGTRRATRYGKDIGEKMVKDIASENITIVSGLAEGIDTVAHKAALAVGGKTIAVLGGGILNIYPTSNISLAKEIVENGGLIISEYKPSEQALTFHFPIRNRIIAGLSKAIFIVEATEKSGSMHTKNYAIEYNREVFALPARTNDIYSVGCNKCIQNGQARLLLNSSEILDFFGKSKMSTQMSMNIQLTDEEKIIYDVLLGFEKNFDEILKLTKFEAKKLQTMLMRLTLKGVVNKLPNNYYALV